MDEPAGPADWEPILSVFELKCHHRNHNIYCVKLMFRYWGSCLLLYKQLYKEKTTHHKFIKKTFFCSWLNCRLMLEILRLLSHQNKLIKTYGMIYALPHVFASGGNALLFIHSWFNFFPVVFLVSEVIITFIGLLLGIPSNLGL